MVKQIYNDTWNEARYTQDEQVTMPKIKRQIAFKLQDWTMFYSSVPYYFKDIILESARYWNEIEMLARCTCKMNTLKRKDFEANTETKTWIRHFAMSLGSF